MKKPAIIGGAIAGSTIITIVIVVVLFLFGMGACRNYNSLVEKSNEVENAWAAVQTQYQRRADLIPNLVNTVKGAAAHEQKTLQAVTDARAKAGSINLSVENLTEENLQKFQQAQNELSSALKSLLAVSESYPNITATQNFKDLQAQLEGTENRIGTARTDYTKAVKEYNNSVMKFPSNIFAAMFGFEKKPQFAADEAAQTAPTVEF